MAKFEKKLTELNLTEKTISHGLRAKIADYRKSEGLLKDIKQRLKSGDYEEEDEKEELKEQFSNLEGALDGLDEEIIRHLIKFDKNKDKYAQMGEKLKNSSKKSATPAEPTPNPTPTPEPEPEPTPAPAPEPTPEPTPTPEPKKEGSGAAGLILGGLFVVLSGGLLYRYFKNK
jgi:uncharacterized coiled-coil protein SlyX